MERMKNLPKMVLDVAGHSLQTYVAREEAERALGLMHRAELPAGEGMLFVCDEPAVQSFWMKDTPLPLSAAFIADDGTIVHLEDMEPHSLRAHRCEQPVRHVLEVNQGWFEERGVRPGMRIDGPPFLA